MQTNEYNFLAVRAFPVRVSASSECQARQKVERFEEWLSAVAVSLVDMEEDAVLPLPPSGVKSLRK